MLQIESNSRQIPSIEAYTADKKYCDLLYVTRNVLYGENR